MNKVLQSLILPHPPKPQPHTPASPPHLHKLQNCPPLLFTPIDPSGPARRHGLSPSVLHPPNHLATHPPCELLQLTLKVLHANVRAPHPSAATHGRHHGRVLHHGVNAGHLLGLQKSQQAGRSHQLLFLLFLLIDCYSLDRTLEIHGAANTKQIQEKCTSIK